MPKLDVYERLGEHLSHLGMGYPLREDLIEILRQNFTPQEAEVALALPTKVIPLQPVGIEEILTGIDLSMQELVHILEDLVQKGLLYCAKTKDGKRGYALQQVGFGFPQSFFWKGEETPQARKMSGLIAKYFSRDVTQEAFSSDGDTKPYRYIPVGRSVKADRQAIYPLHMMESVIEQAKQIALAHCPCRMTYSLRGGECSHPTEVCMKFNDLAQYLIDRGLGRDSEGDIQHNCNCCGCACWNVGNIRRRKIPRDVLMATYFFRETDEEQCIGCGECVEICPVDALKMEDEIPVVDEDWCIGCGVCATVCNTDAIEMKLRPDKTGQLPAAKFQELHEKILEEKGLR
jgi:NAD-dependent dihydropyrimidine dehydrogenase PreA subunit